MKRHVLTGTPLVRTLIRSVVLAMSLLLASDAHAAVMVAYTATDLSDTTPGEDLWEYTYLVSGFSFLSGEGFTIYFDSALYGAIESLPPAPSADWDAIGVPSPFVPVPGYYDALALVDTPSLADPFTVQFVWLGTGVPGVQDFDVYDAGFTVVQSGVTTVPEPVTALLLMTAPVALAWRTYRRRRA
jgi:hypothetical protein